MLTTTRRRHWARNACRTAALASACMLVLSAWVLVTGGQSPVSAATSSGSLKLDVASGNSDTPFTVSFVGTATSCPGDATAGYRVQGFVVPAATNLNTLTFNSVGPSAGQALIDTTGNPLVAAAPDLNTGNISQLPAAYTFAFNSPGNFPAGDWLISIGCSKTGALQNYWTVPITITQNTSTGGPAQIDFAVGGGSGTTTTTTGGGTTTTTAGGTTTTTAGGTTTTTADGTTTTTADGTTTTTAAADVSGSDVFSGGSPSAASPVTTAGQLPYTGSSPLPIVFWAICLLVFGRAAMLLGKRPKVIDDGPTG